MTKTTILFFFNLIALSSLFSQKSGRLFNNSDLSVDYGYNIYYENDTTILDGITWGGRLTRIFALGEYDAFHVGVKVSYHSRNAHIRNIGNVIKRNGEIGVFVGWNDVGDQAYISGRYSYLMGDGNLIGAEVRIGPFNKIFNPNIELMFYLSPHVIIQKNEKAMAGITLGSGITYHLKKK